MRPWEILITTRDKEESLGMSGVEPLPKKQSRVGEKE
jgi:hypothetical protein